MKTNPYWITDKKQLAALASPLRQEIVDAVSAAGACTIVRIAEVLSCQPDRLYFHIRRLVAVGLLIQRGVNGNGRKAAAVYDVPGRPLRIRHNQRSKEEVRSVTAIQDAILRLSRRDLKHALASPDSVTGGDYRDTRAGRSRGWLTPAELRRLNRLVERMHELVRRGSWRPGTKPIALTFIIAPPRRPRVTRNAKGDHP